MSSVDTFWDELMSSGSIYRVCIHINTNRVEVACIGMGCVDYGSPRYYDMEELPEWVVGRIAVLSLCDTVPPTPSIEGVGRRIDETTFWIER